MSVDNSKDMILINKFTVEIKNRLNEEIQKATKFAKEEKSRLEKASKIDPKILHEPFTI